MKSFSYYFKNRENYTSTLHVSSRCTVRIRLACQTIRN